MGKIITKTRIELTDTQWEHLRAAVLSGRPLNNDDAPRLIGLTKGEWRGTKKARGLRDLLIDCGWLVARGNDRKAGYAPTRALWEFLDCRRWQS